MVSFPKSRHVLSALVAIAVFASYALAADSVANAGDRAPFNLIPHMSVLPDPTGSLSIRDMNQPEVANGFKALSGSSVNLGIVRHPHWFRVELSNPTEFLRKKALELNNPRLSEVKFYAISPNGDYEYREAGVLTPVSQHQWVSPEPAFPIDVAPHSTQTVYLRIAHNGSLRFRAKLWERSDYRRHGGVVVALCGFFVGAIALIALYNYVVFIDLRERAYLYLALLATMLGLYVLSKNGFARLLLWGKWPWWSDRADMALLAVVLCLTVLFADAFLHGARYAPRTSRWTRILALVFFLEAPLCLTDITFKYYLLHVSGLAGVLVVTTLAWNSWRAGFAPAKPFIRALGPVVVGMAFLSLLGPGMLSSNAVTEYGVEMSFLFTGALWLQSLTSRLRTQAAAHSAQLERRVKDRTADLSRALAEVKTLSGLLPMCSGCKKIRDDTGYWNSVESYVQEHSHAQISHGLCPDCVREYFSEYFDPDEEIG